MHIIDFPAWSLRIILVLTYNALAPKFRPHDGEHLKQFPLFITVDRVTRVDSHKRP